MRAFNHITSGESRAEKREEKGRQRMNTLNRTRMMGMMYRQIRKEGDGYVRVCMTRDGCVVD